MLCFALKDFPGRAKEVAFLHLKPCEGALRAPQKFGEHEDLSNANDLIRSFNGEQPANSRVKREQRIESKLQMHKN